MLLVRFLQTIIVLSLLGIIFVLFQAGASAAGQVIFTADYPAGQAITFDNPETLHVFQGDLRTDHSDFYVFHASQGTFLQIKLDTLRLAGQDNFRPSLAVFGPGLPPPLDSESGLLPFSLPAGAGLQLSMVSDSDIAAENKTGHVVADQVDEPWTGGSYWERQTLGNELPQDGTYYLAVFSSLNQSGAYALQVGDKPQAGVRETLTFPVTWLRVHLRFGDVWGPILAGLTILLVILGLLWMYFKNIGHELLAWGRRGTNRRRRDLLQRRLGHKPVTQRLKRPLKHVIPAQLRPVTPVPEPEPVLLPQPAPVLAGTSWESLGKVLILPQPATSNGNGHHPTTSNNGNGHAPDENSNGHTLQNGHVKDGLQQWGEALRPQATDSLGGKS